MYKKTIVLTLSAILSGGLLAGCAANDSAMVYSPGQTGQAQSVQLGTVISVQTVKVEGQQNGLVTLGGAALGGLAGSSIGQGKGSAAGAIAGVLLGGTATQAAQKGMGGQNGYEITVKLDSGGTISIVQGTDVQLQVNQRVRVLSGGGKDRVVPL